MRFLCMCSVILSGLVAIRCFVSTPEPPKAAANILRWVLANDSDWKEILIQELNVKAVDFGNMLADLKLTNEPDAKITPNQIIQKLVTHKGTTGSQFMYGIQVLSIALNNQFMKTLMVHFHLACYLAESMEETELKNIQIFISKIQMTIVIFANKLAFFDHPIDIFVQLNDEINNFFKLNNDIFQNKNNSTIDDKNLLKEFFLKLYKFTKEKVEVASHYKHVDAKILNNLMTEFNIIDLETSIEEISKDLLFEKINEINDYKQVNVSSIGLDVIEKKFNVHKYSLNTDN